MPNSPVVLVVEDDVSTQGLLLAVVRRLGLEAKAAGDGHVALDMIAAERPSAIILDLLMPVVDGFEVLRRLKRTAPELLNKTIVITAAAIRNDGEHPDLDLAWKFLRKPLDIEQLGAYLLDCVHRSSQKTGRDGVYETPPQP